MIKNEYLISTIPLSVAIWTLPLHAQEDENAISVKLSA